MATLMDTTKLTTVISLLVAVSIASERLVDIIKGLVPWLNQQRRKPVEEGWRKAALQVIAVIAGTTAWLARRFRRMISPGSSRLVCWLVAVQDSGIQS